MDFFGQTSAGVPPFTFDFLQNTARYFANAAIQSEQRFIEFMDRYQTAQMTRLDLQHASDLAAKEVEAAAARQAEAQALVDSSQHSVDLAQTRFQDATNTLNLFNSTAWEAEELAGFIARGSAFTGSDQPNLNYQIGDTSYSGPKHQVLQQLTQRQTEIGVDLQRDHLQSAVDELDKARQVAADQKAAADAHLKGAQTDGQIAALDQQRANEMLQSFDSQFFTPEQWWAMAMFMRASLSGVGVSFTPPGTANPIQLTFDNNNTIPRKNIPITGTPSAFGDYQFQFGADGAKDKLGDLILIMDYTFQPAT